MDSKGIQAATPLPTIRLFLLMLAQLNEVIMFTQLNPYLPFMIKEFLQTNDDADPRIGMYTGMLITTFTAVQALTSPLWGWVSDKYGRRPVVLAGLMGCIISNTLFAYSSTLYFAFGARALTGLLNGNIVAVRTYLSEILDKSNQAKGFGYFGVSLAAGLAIGPNIGGSLYGVVSSGPFGAHPWTLPTLTSVFFTSLTFLLCVFKLTETHVYVPLKKKLDHSGQINDDETKLRPLVASVETPPEESNMRLLCSNKNFWLAATLLGLVMSLPVANIVLMPLWAQVGKELNGWAWNPSMIGIVHGFSAVPIFIGNAIVFPRIAKFGLLKLLRIVQLIPVIIFLLYPLFENVTNYQAQVALMFVVFSILPFGFGLAMTICNMLVPNTVYREVLGTAMGASQTIQSFARVGIPLFSGMLFAWGIEREASNKSGSNIPLANRYLSFYVLAFISMLVIIISFMMDKEFDHPKPPQYKFRSNEKKSGNTNTVDDLKSANAT